MKFPALTSTWLMCGVGTVAESTEMVPFTARLLAQTTPVPPPDTVIAAPPETAWLNNWNVSPATKAGPWLLTVTEPVPVLARVPETTAMPLDGVRDLFRETDTFPAKL